MKRVTVDTFNRIITSGIVEDAEMEATLFSIGEQFESLGFRALFCYDGRTTFVRGEAMASVTVKDANCGDVIRHGSAPGVPLTCLQNLFPS